MGVVSVTLYLLIVYVCIFEGLYHLCNWLCIFHWFRLARVSVWSCLCEVVSLKLQHAGYTYQYVSLLRVGFSRTTESAVEGDCEKITCSSFTIWPQAESVWYLQLLQETYMCLIGVHIAHWPVEVFCKYRSFPISQQSAAWTQLRRPARDPVGSLWLGTCGSPAQLMCSWLVLSCRLCRRKKNWPWQCLMSLSLSAQWWHLEVLRCTSTLSTRAEILLVVCVLAGMASLSSPRTNGFSSRGNLAPPARPRGRGGRPQRGPAYRE